MIDDKRFSHGAREKEFDIARRRPAIGDGNTCMSGGSRARREG